MLSFPPPVPQSKFTELHDTVINWLPQLQEGGLLYKAQVEALNNLKTHFADASKPNIGLVVMPTGAGKSGVAVLAPFVLNSTKVLIITPSLIISNQLYNDMCGAGENNFFVKKGITTAADAHRMTVLGYKLDCGKSNDEVCHQFNNHNLVITNAHKFGTNSGFNLEDLPHTMFDTVIVDEAHHYPAATWKRLVDHFPNSRRVFLTATPYHQGKNILGNSMDDQTKRYLAYQLTREDAVSACLIRPLQFVDSSEHAYKSHVNTVCEKCGYSTHYRDEVDRILCVVFQMLSSLKEHDKTVNIFHQGMILCYLTEEVDRVVAVMSHMFSACQLDERVVAYHGNSNKDGFEQFCGRKGNIPLPRFLVVCGKATEGFDRREISVVGILRNVSVKSSVLFSQFVGRCVRRAGPQDNCIAVVVSHPFHEQRRNFEKMDELAEVDPDDVDV